MAVSRIETSSGIEAQRSFMPACNDKPAPRYATRCHAGRPRCARRSRWRMRRSRSRAPPIPGRRSPSGICGTAARRKAKARREAGLEAERDIPLRGDADDHAPRSRKPAIKPAIKPSIKPSINRPSVGHQSAY
ncbi:hypothetical protein [Roseateles sp.]|uniref:hypothetical protein n=1 Tax=Roseateles sp. TaxID=1971397 RepID=UPI002F3FF3EB